MLDYKDFAKMCDNYASMVKNFEAFLIDFLLEEAKWVQGATKDRTPVKTGHLRGRWRITKVYKLSSGNLGFTLVNDADYASYVELGHATKKRDKWVEGYFMATISIAKLEERMPADFEKEFILFLRKHGVQ
ncbi:HK97 gp10 family phage protein [[Clostridium] innocuum]|nr:HK97 gp10 family phage protein [[Clostridium] innocuum]MCR0577079.1 HK97 gp10 family phage protein [[Clostridium] innocuum]